MNAPIRRVTFASVWLFAVCSIGMGSAHCQAPETPTDLKIRYIDAKGEIEKNTTAEREKLFTGYTAAVERLQADFRQKGDLQNVLKAKAEIELARTKNQAGTEEIPGIAQLRGVLTETLSKIDSNHAARMTALNQAYIEKMAEHMAALTRAGDLEHALAIDKEIKSIKGLMAEPAASSASGESPMSPGVPVDLSNPPTGPVTVSIVDSYANESPFRDGTIAQDVTVPVGKHRIKGRTIIGERSVPKGQKPQRVTLSLESGTTLEGGEIFIDVGQLSASGARFDKVRLMANLGGEFLGSSCLFDESTVEKAGGWFSGYSSKWTLYNCVVRKSIAGGEFNRSAVGLKWSYCTFVDVAFPPVTYSEDSGKEAQEPWRTIENCRFIDCSVPRSLLLMTRNCVFENCTFPERDDSSPLGTTGISVTLYHSGSSFPAPASYGKGTFTVADGSLLKPAPGSTVKYKSSPSSLEFE